MKKIITLLLLLIIGSTTQLSAQSWEKVKASRKGELNVYYFENEPYAYTDSKGNLTGLEVDILKSFVDWLLEKKKISLDLNYQGFSEFNKFYAATKNGEMNTIGLGSVTITNQRKSDLKFSAPYLKNVSVLITDGTVATARDNGMLKELLLDLKAITIEGSMHQVHLDDLYHSFDMKPSYSVVSEVEMVPAKIKESAKYFGYIDIISFWKYIKNNNHYIKMHSIANKADEQFGFVMPLSSGWDEIINEFFESGFGFTSTKEYHRILEKHLSFEIIDRVELD